MKKRLILSVVAFVFLGINFFFANTRSINSVPPKSVKDSLSSSQYSYFATLSSGNSANDTMIKIDTGTGPAHTTNNLFIGDTITIGVGTSMHTYYIKDVGATNTFFINVGVSTVDIGASAVAIATRSAIHTVSFEPQVNATGGKWQFLVKATSTTGENFIDGIPDQNGFDAKLLTNGAVTCPFGIAAATNVGTTLGVAMGSPAVTSYYNVIDCQLGAGTTNPVGVGLTGTITIGVGNSQLINPTNSHAASAEGQAESFTYILRHYDSTGTLLDQTPGKIAVVESVRVTATVDPSLTFTIDNTNTTTVGTSVCPGATLSAGAVSTTGDTVIFGTLGLATFNNLAQRLGVVTNGPSGYVVTVYENAAMKNVNTGTTIANTNCDGACSYTAAAAWATDTANSEFGYTMTNVGSSVVFTAPSYKAFGVGNAQAQEIMKRTNVPTSTEYAYICYRLTASTTQEAGDYEAKVVYTATATF